MRFSTRCAIILSACFSVWMLAENSEAQRRVIRTNDVSGNNFASKSSNQGVGGSSSSGGHHQGQSHSPSNHHHGHHHGHSHSHGHSFSPYYGIGSPYFGGRYYSSYTSVYSPFGGTFAYGTVSPNFGYYNSPWCYPSGYYASPAYNFFPSQFVAPNYPPFTQPLIDAQAEAEARWTEALKLGSHIKIPIKPVIASSTQEKLRSQRLQISGDELFRKQFFSQALKQYREANSVAKDLPGPYFRMAVVYAIQGKFDASVTYLKRALELDPDWPAKGETLTMLYGEDNALARNALLIEIANWVEEDIRDPNRSFLMGAFLYEFDREKAATFLETSARLSGSTLYVAPYLNPAVAEAENDAPPQNGPPQPPPAIDVPEPPLPQVDPSLNQNRPAPVPQDPSGLGLTTPRGARIVIPTYQSPLRGPELPPLGN